MKRTRTFAALTLAALMTATAVPTAVVAATPAAAEEAAAVTTREEARMAFDKYFEEQGERSIRLRRLREYDDRFEAKILNSRNFPLGTYKVMKATGKVSRA